MNTAFLRRAGAVFLALTIAILTFAPTDAEARRWRRGHGHGGAVAAGAAIGILGIAAAAAAADANRERCWIERRRYVKPSGRVVLRDVEVCD